MKPERLIVPGQICASLRFAAVVAAATGILSSFAWSAARPAKNVARGETSEKYRVAQGDALRDVSKRLFGDPYAIPSAHELRPGQTIAFKPGTVTSLPEVSVQSEDRTLMTSARTLIAEQDSDADILIPRKKRRSREWRQLPPQPWESAPMLDINPNDQIKAESPIIAADHIPTTEELPAIVLSAPVAALGVVAASPVDTEIIPTGAKLLISAKDGALQAGQTYSVLSQVQVLKSKANGYAYPVAGELRVIAQREIYWEAIVTRVTGELARGSYIIAQLPRIPKLGAIPGPATLYGMFLVDHKITTFLTAQHGYGFVDLGAEDGIKEGMIFQSYQYQDPTLKKDVTSEDIFPVATMQVVQVSEHFCTVELIAGTSTVAENTPVKLITDLSQLRGGASTAAAPASGSELPAPPADDSAGPPPVAEPVPSADEGAPAATLDSTPPPPATAPETVPTETPENDLDKYDGDDSLKGGERRELKQLEKWKDNGNVTASPGNPAAPPPPPPPESDAMPKPPPPENAPLPPADDSGGGGASNSGGGNQDLPPAEGAPSP